MEETAMFPLSSVLMPFTPLPLRIFEERYRVMLRQLLESDDPSFGVVLISEGSEQGGGDLRHSLGTLAQVVRVAVGEGDIQIMALGGRRFEVVEWLPDDPFPRARIRLLDPLVWSDTLSEVRAAAEHSVRRALAVAAEFGQEAWTSAAELAEDPLVSSWQLAAIAPLPEPQRLALLGSVSLADLLTDLISAAESAAERLRTPSDDATFDEAVQRLLDDEEDDGSPPL